MFRAILNALFGGGARAVTNVVEVFRPNAERGARRNFDVRTAAMAQFAAEFQQPPVGPFDSFVNGLNRLPRPFMALGGLGFFVFASIDPVGFAARMAALELVPAHLWILLTLIFTFYFGGRETEKIRTAKSMDKSRVAAVLDQIQQIEALRPAVAVKTEAAPDDADDDDDAATPGGNAAIAAWKAGR